MWFKNLKVYRLTHFEMTPEQMNAALAANELQPTSGLQMQSSGWIRPKEGGDSFVHQCKHHMLITMGSEKKLLPTSVINAFAKERAREFEEMQGFKPGRKQMRQIKEVVTDELLPRAFSLQSKTEVWIDPVGKLLVINAGSNAKADDVVALLVKSVDKINLVPLRTANSPSSAMTDWIVSGEVPSEFTLDDTCEMRAGGDSKGSVRYSKLTPDAEEIKKHIISGKTPVKQAMTWNDRISFVLDEQMQIKRVQALDLLAAEADPEADVFDADFALMTGELSGLIASLASALGGENAQ